MRLTGIALPWLALFASSCMSVPPEPAADRALVVTGVSIIDPESGSASVPQDILIRSGTIAALMVRNSAVFIN